MKPKNHFLIICIITVFTSLLFSCKKEEVTKKPDQEIQLTLLSKTWKIDNVSFENSEDRTTSFADGKLVISGSYLPDGIYDFSFTGMRPALSPWPASGKWKFGSNLQHNLIRNPTPASPSENLLMNYTVTESQLTLIFTCETCDFAGGRRNSISGEWKFIFKDE
jgi:hypothetical protein